MEQMRNAYKVYEGKRPLWRTSRRWKYNIKMDVEEIGLEDMDWIHLSQDTDQFQALVNAVINLRV
jgi:hypothetical protein